MQKRIFLEMRVMYMMYIGTLFNILSIQTFTPLSLAKFKLEIGRIGLD